MNRIFAMSAGLAFSATAHAAFVGATIVEGDSAAASAALGQSATVLHVYAAFDGMGDGQANTVLSTSFVHIGLVSGTMYQDALGTNLPPNSAFFPIVPTLLYDTYGTIGVATSDAPGGASIAVEPGTTMTTSMITGGWFNGDPPSAAGAATVELGDGTFGTLLFQITVLNAPEVGSNVITSHLTGSMSVFTQGAGQAIENIVKFPPIPSPGALGLFGAAGVVARRRRR